MYCTECGKLQSDTAKFCSSCGNKLPVSDESPTPKYRKQGRDIDTKHKNSESDGLAFFIISILCIATIFIPLGSFGESFFDRATADCMPSPIIHSDGSIEFDDPDCEIRDGGRIAILFLGLIGSICFLLSHQKRPEYEGHYTQKKAKQSPRSKPVTSTHRKPYNKPSRSKIESWFVLLCLLFLFLWLMEFMILR